MTRNKPWWMSEPLASTPYIRDDVWRVITVKSHHYEVYVLPLIELYREDSSRRCLYLDDVEVCCWDTSVLLLLEAHENSDSLYILLHYPMRKRAANYIFWSNKSLVAHFPFFTVEIEDVWIE
jgi:hypothetical protein